MAKVVICPICGRSFETSKPNKKYCSFTCKEAGNKLRRMVWRNTHPHYDAAYMKKYRAERKEIKENEH